MRKSFIAIAFFSIVFNCCTVFKKTISKNVVVKFADTLFLPTLNAKTEHVKYITKFSLQEYTQAFLAGFKLEASITKNVTLDNSSTNPDFIIKLKKFVLEESEFVQKINDPNSTYNGKELLLNKLDCNVTIEVFDVKNNKILSDCTDLHNKSEQVSNNRNLNDLITGQNKDHGTYHDRLMNDYVSKNMSEAAGRRIWVPLSYRISKAEK